MPIHVRIKTKHFVVHIGSGNPGRHENGEQRRLVIIELLGHKRSKLEQEAICCVATRVTAGVICHFSPMMGLCRSELPAAT